MAAVVTGMAGASRPTTSASPRARLWWWSSAIALALVLVLAVTGVLLWFTYRPGSAQSWGAIAHARYGSTQPEWVVHRLAGWVLLPVALLVAISGIAARWERGRRIPWPAAAIVLAVVASATGFLLPWDQLALWAVTVGTDIRGVRGVFGEQVRFVLVDGAEISPSTYRRWAVIHVAVGAVVAATAIPRRTRPR